MTKNHAKYFSVILLITLVAEQLNAAYAPEIASVIETNQANQLDIQIQKQQQKHEELVQHTSKSFKSEDAAISFESVKEAKQASPGQHYESYDTNDDVVVKHAHVENEDDYDMLNDEHVDDNEMEIDEEEEEDDTGNYSTTLSRKRRELSDWLIAPNTRWCGRGNTAEGRYNHLGGASAADKCCRKHDHCKIYIHGMSNRYELFNYRPYTLSHCSCDRRFRTCLKMANDEDATTIGKLFFNMVQTQCFILRSETICQKRAADGSCETEFVKQKAYLRDNKKF